MDALEAQFASQVSIIFWLSHHLVGVPYRWDEQTQAIKHEGSVTQKIILRFNLLAYMTYEAFVLWRFFGVIDNSVSTLSEVANMGYNLCGNLLPLMLLMHLATNWGCHSLVMNASLRYYRVICGKHQLQTIREFRAISILAGFVITANVVNFVRRPMQHHLLTSLLHSDRFQAATVLLFVVHLHIWVLQWLSILFSLTVFMIAMRIILLNSKKSTYSGSMRLQEKIKLRYSVSRKYSQHYLLMANINAECRWLTLSFEIIMIMILTACFFASVRTSDGLLAVRLCIVACVATTVALTMFSSMADVHADFQQMLTSWKNLPLRDAWFRRFMKSVRPIGVMVGSYFEADKGLVMTIAGIILDNTVSLLMV